MEASELQMMFIDIATLALDITALIDDHGVDAVFTEPTTEASLAFSELIQTVEKVKKHHGERGVSILGEMGVPPELVDALKRATF